MDNTKQNNSAAKFELLARCPFCGGSLSIENNITAADNGFRLSHSCFAHIYGNYISISTIEFRGKTKKEVAERWNRRAKT